MVLGKAKEQRGWTRQHNIIISAFIHNIALKRIRGNDEYTRERRVLGGARGVGGGAWVVSLQHYAMSSH